MLENGFEKKNNIDLIKKENSEREIESLTKIKNLEISNLISEIFDLNCSIHLYKEDLLSSTYKTNELMDKIKLENEKTNDLVCKLKEYEDNNEQFENDNKSLKSAKLKLKLEFTIEKSLLVLNINDLKNKIDILQKVNNDYEIEIKLNKEKCEGNVVEEINLRKKILNLEEIMGKLNEKLSDFSSNLNKVKTEKIEIFNNLSILREENIKIKDLTQSDLQKDIIYNNVLEINKLKFEEMENQILKKESLIKDLENEKINNNYTFEKKCLEFNDEIKATNDKHSEFEIKIKLLDKEIFEKTILYKSVSEKLKKEKEELINIIKKTEVENENKISDLKENSKKF